MKNANKSNNIELSVVMPCLNEERTVGTCIRKATDYFATYNISGEVIIADNGSSDASIEIAKANGARIVKVVEKGYGSAIKGGIAASRGEYVIMGDADDSYDFSNLTPYLHKLRQGYDLVMGNRFLGGIMDDAMPFLHKYLGNPVLSFVGKTLYNVPHINDFHCGLRGFNRKSINYLDLESPGMEFASEMVVKAALSNMDLIEIPTKLYKDGRDRAPHLNTWRDGWRHLKLLMHYCPKSVYYPPMLAILLITGMLAAIFAPIDYSFLFEEVYKYRIAIFSGTVFLMLDALLYCYLHSTQALRVQLKPKWKGFSRQLVKR